MFSTVLALAVSHGSGDKPVLASADAMGRVVLSQPHSNHSSHIRPLTIIHQGPTWSRNGKAVLVNRWVSLCSYHCSRRGGSWTGGS